VCVSVEGRGFNSIKLCGVIFCMNYWLCVHSLMKGMDASRDIYVLVCVCVNGFALVLCGHDMWFFGGRNMCAIFCVLTFLVC
jgi:hypothetical protein